MQPLVLVADDEPDVRRFVDYLLRLARFDVVTCADGTTALEAAAQRRPDLLLLDISMPNLDGKQVLREMRERLRDKAPPAIFLTAHADERRAGLELGAADYITKPFSKRDLIERVTAALDRGPAATK